MNSVVFSRLAGALFGLFALVHAYRLAAPFAVQIGSLVVPQAASWAFLAVAGILAFLGLRARP
jgi:hypothetical protein